MKGILSGVICYIQVKGNVISLDAKDINLFINDSNLSVSLSAMPTTTTISITLSKIETRERGQEKHPYPLIVN